MPPKTDHGSLQLRRSFGYRLKLAIVAAPTLLLAIAGLDGLNAIFGPVQGVGGFVVKACVGELLVALLVVSVLSLLWAAATPAWVETLIEKHALVLQAGIFLIIPAFIVISLLLGN